MGKNEHVTRGPLYDKILFTSEQVDARIAEMATEIIGTHKPEETIFVYIPNGALPFTAKLMHAIQMQDEYFQPNAQSLTVSRYGPNREPGQPSVVTDLPPEYRDLRGLNAILLDDLIDEGQTLAFANKHLLEKCGAERVDNVVLVKKIKDPAVMGGLAMFGFEAPDVWLVGMGMDDPRVAREGDRWLEFIATASTK